MILPERVFGRSSDQTIRFGRASLPIRSATCSRISVDQLVGALEVALERDEGADRLAGVLVGLADHRRLGDLRVRDDRRLDLGGREPVAGDVDHVVDAADHPEVAVLVLARGVADEVGLLAELREVGLDVAVVLLVERAQHRPATGVAAPAGPARPRPRCPPRRAPRPRSRAAACRPSPGFAAWAPGQRRDHDVAGLGLPPGVDDRTALAADHLPVPEPRLRVDRLADRAEQPQRREVVLARVLGAPLHAGADRGRRRVEDRHPVALDQLPPDVLVGVVGAALPHHRGRAVEQRPVDDVGVPGDPADVGAAPVDVLVGLEVEDVACGSTRPRSGSRRWCAGSPSASRSSPRCRGCRAGARRRARPAGHSVVGVPRSPRRSRRRGPRSSRRRRRCCGRRPRSRSRAPRRGTRRPPA